MNKYDTAREQVKQLLTSNNFPADVGIWSEFLKIIDGLEKEDEWVPFDPENIPEAKSQFTLLVNVPHEKGAVACFVYRYGEWHDDNGDGFDNYSFGKNCT